MGLALAGGPLKLAISSIAADVSAPSKPRSLQLGWESTIVCMPSSALALTAEFRAGTRYLAIRQPDEPQISPLRCASVEMTEYRVG